MKPLEITPYSLGLRYVGISEMKGRKRNHPLVTWWLHLCGYQWDSPDEIPWCSAFPNGICWELRLPRSKSARARSWLGVGYPIAAANLEVGYDVVILNRGGNPDPTVIESPGHVGFYAGYDKNGIKVLGGNQKDSVNIAVFPAADILGCIRLIPT